MPVPVSGTECGLPNPSSVIVSAPVIAPIAEGANVISNEQLAPDARVAAQVVC